MITTKSAYEIEKIPDPQDNIEVLKFLEKIGRTCYKSEDKITKNSCIKFIDNIKKSKHWSVLEHYIFVFKVPDYVYDDIKIINQSSCPDIKMKSHYIVFSENGNDKIVSFSASAINGLYESFIDNRLQIPLSINILMKSLYSINSYLVSSLYNDEYTNNLEILKPLSRNDVLLLNPDNRLLHDSMTVKFIVDRAIANEIVRHRNMTSYCQESSRYCNYSKDKFNNEIIMIDTFDGYHESNEKDYYNMIGSLSELAYKGIIEAGNPPEIARSILPHALKTEIYMTTRKWEWRHFFKMRCDKHAHPNLRNISKNLLLEFIKKDKDSFSNIVVG